MTEQSGAYYDVRVDIPDNVMEELERISEETGESIAEILGRLAIERIKANAQALNIFFDMPRVDTKQ